MHLATYFLFPISFLLRCSLFVGDLGLRDGNYGMGRLGLNFGDRKGDKESVVSLGRRNRQITIRRKINTIHPQPYNPHSVFISPPER